MKKIIFGILGTIFVLIIGIIVAAGLYINSLLDDVIVDNSDDVKEEVDLNINENLKESDVVNMALFGVDCRVEGFSGCRSDVMMIVSYNPDADDVTVTSVVRDTFTDIEGYGTDKINHAYAFGGPDLAVQTLNKTFDLNIEHYVTVDFFAVEKIIDSLGGVKVNVSDAEVPHVNQYLKELNNVATDGEYSSNLTSSGEQVLDGRQAVAYMRIRYVGDGDFERMERQRKVMDAALSNLTEASLPELLTMVEELVPSVETNMPKSKMISLVTDVVFNGIPTMTQSQIPTRDGGIGTTINGIYYFVPNTLLENNILLHDLIYPKETYEPSEDVEALSSKLKGYLY